MKRTMTRNLYLILQGVERQMIFLIRKELFNWDSLHVNKLHPPVQFLWNVDLWNLVAFQSSRSEVCYGQNVGIEQDKAGRKPVVIYSFSFPSACLCGISYFRSKKNGIDLAKSFNLKEA